MQSTKTVNINEVITLSKGERTRLNILECAIQCFSENGFENASLTELSESAQVNRALIIHYFNSVEGLARACFIHVSKHVRQFMETELTNSHPVPTVGPLISRQSEMENRVMLYARTYFRWLEEHPHHAGFILSSLQRSAYHKGTRQLLRPLMKAAWLRIESFLKTDTRFSTDELGTLAKSIHSEIIGSMLFYYSGLVPHLRKAEAICIAGVLRIINSSKR